MKDEELVVDAEDIPERELVARKRAIPVRGHDAWGNNVVSSDDPIWAELKELGEKITVVRIMMDDLPSRVKTLEKLEVKMDSSFTPTFWVSFFLIILIITTISFWLGTQL